MIDCSETAAMVILILNIVFPGFGTLISSCLDRNGCNCSAVCLSFLQAFTIPLCLLGWVWSIMWGIRVHAHNRGKF